MSREKSFYLSHISRTDSLKEGVCRRYGFNERNLTKKHCEEQDSKREYISFFSLISFLCFSIRMVLWLLSRCVCFINFGCHVSLSSSYFLLVFIFGLSKSKIYKFQIKVSLYNSILKLDIKMSHSALVMHETNCMKNLHKERVAQLFIESCLSGFNILKQIPSFTVLKNYISNYIVQLL